MNHSSEAPYVSMDEYEDKPLRLVAQLEEGKALLGHAAKETKAFVLTAESDDVEEELRESLITHDIPPTDFRNWSEYVCQALGGCVRHAVPVLP